MEGNASISQEILASYAADAAREVDGVRGLVDGHLPRRGGVRISGGDDGGALRIELHLAVDWGASIPVLGAAVQERVREYVGRMTDLRVDAVDVVVDEIA
jgi:uncharacterized alkaline shock family protein YloU